MKKMSLFGLIVMSILLFCVGCGSNKEKNEEEMVNNIKKYSVMDYGLKNVYGLEAQEDMYVCLGENDNSEIVQMTGTLGDNTFSERKIILGDEFKQGHLVSAACIGDEGEMWLVVSWSKEGIIENKICMVDLDDSIDILKCDLNENIEQIRVLPDNSGYVVGCRNESIHCYSMNGERLWSIQNDEFVDFCVMKDCLVVLNKKNIQIYDLRTGNQLENGKTFVDTLLEDVEETFLHKGENVLSCKKVIKYDEKTEALYLLLETGLYEYNIENNLAVKLYEFQDDAVRYDFVLENKDSFVVIESVDRMNTNTKTVMAYSADDKYKNISLYENEKTTSLTVYSLYYEEYLECLIDVFEKENDSIEIKYIWGMDEKNGISVSEAIDSLNAQLLAGAGPDVILMDGLNERSYENAGVLMELSDVVNEIQNKYPNCLMDIVCAYKTNDRVYALPSRAQFIALVGPERDIADVGNVELLVEYINNVDKPYFGNDLNFYEWEAMFDTIYPVYSSSIVDVDGNYESQNLRMFLEDFKSLYDLEMSRTTKDEITEWINENGQYNKRTNANRVVLNNLYNTEWSGQKIALINMSSMVSLQKFYSVKRNFLVSTGEESDANKDYVYNVWGTLDEKIFIPTAVFAINENSNNKTGASEFVIEMFSAHIQKSFYTSNQGNPGNTDAILEWNSDMLEIGTPGGVFEIGGNRYLMSAYFTDEADMNEYIGALKTLKIPANTDARVEEIIKENMQDYLNDEMSLDETFDAIDNVLNIYLSE